MDSVDIVNAVVAMEDEGAGWVGVRRVARTVAGLLNAPVLTMKRPHVIGEMGEARLVVLARLEEPGSDLLASVRDLAPPVVVVPAGMEAFELRRVLVPLTAPASGSLALAATVRLAGDLDLDLLALHVTQLGAVPPFGDQPQHETDAWVYSLLSRYLPVTPDRLQVELRVGEPAEQILSFAAEGKVDLIALSWERDLSPGRARVVRPVVEASPVPVLLLPLSRTPRSA